MSGSDQSSMPLQDQQQHQNAFGFQDGNQSQMGEMPMQMEGSDGNFNPMNQIPFSTFSTFQQQSQPISSSNTSDLSAFSAIHTPIDFGDLGAGMTAAMQPNMMMNNSANFLAPPSQQQQFNPSLDVSAQSSGFQSPMYMTTPAMTDGSAGVSGTSTPLGKDANKSTKSNPKPRAPKKPKVNTSEGKNEQQSGIKNGESSTDSKTTKKQTKKAKDPNEPKQTKPRKRKSIGPENTENASSPAVGTPQSITGENEVVQNAEGKSTSSNRGRGGGATGKGRGGRGRGGLSGANSRRTSQVDGVGLSGDNSMQDDQVSRANSLAPGTGESTPTKRGAKAGRGVGRGRGGGRRRGTTTGRGSRATSGRATASVVPGQESGTAAPDDGLVGDRLEGEEEGEEGIAEIDEEEEEEGFDLGLEEDEMDLQEAIQKKRAINMKPLMEAMTEEQQDRYSAFRRHFLDKRFVRRLLYHLTRQTITPQIVTLIAGVGKVFVGQIVEKAREVRQERLIANLNHSSQSQTNQRQSLRPDHLIEALRRYREERDVPGRFAPGTPNAAAGISGNGKRRRMF